jgi:hypothetical protein
MVWNPEPTTAFVNSSGRTFHENASYDPPLRCSMCPNAEVAALRKGIVIIRSIGDTFVQC